MSPWAPRNIILLFAVAIGIWCWKYQTDDRKYDKSQAREQITQALQTAKDNLTQAPSVPSFLSIAQANTEGLNNVPVMDRGEVIRILPDDRHNIRHQRFIVRTAEGSTVLIVHNIDVAPRIEDLKPGDQVIFKGEFVHNQQGGLVHWTHCGTEPQCRGWLEYKGKHYQ